MGLADIVRSGIATADLVTKSLQVNVTIEPWISDDGSGNHQYGGAVTVKALVEPRKGIRRTTDGKEVMQYAQITIIGPFSDNGASDRSEPIDPRGRITLPDGHVGPIISVNGLTDPKTSRPYMYEVSVG